MAHGAQAAIDFRSGDLRIEIRRATNDQGLDVVFDPVRGARFAEAQDAGLEHRAVGKVVAQVKD